MIADSKVRVVIDHGHGGGDSGVVHAGIGLREADVVLKVAHVLKAILDTHPEFDATLTREDDRTVGLKERTDLANARDAYLVSIHCNGADDPRVGGAEVWCFARFDADGGESAGYRIARSIQGELVALGLRDRGVKPIYDRRRERFVGQKLRVLRKSRQPAVLIECALLSNRTGKRRGCSAATSAGSGSGWLSRFSRACAGRCSTERSADCLERHDAPEGNGGDQGSPPQAHRPMVSTTRKRALPLIMRS